MEKDLGQKSLKEVLIFYFDFDFFYPHYMGKFSAQIFMDECLFDSECEGQNSNISEKLSWHCNSLLQAKTSIFIKKDKLKTLYVFIGYSGEENIKSAKTIANHVERFMLKFGRPMKITVEQITE